MVLSVIVVKQRGDNGLEKLRSKLLLWEVSAISVKLSGAFIAISASIFLSKNKRISCDVYSLLEIYGFTLF